MRHQTNRRSRRRFMQMGVAGLASVPFVSMHVNTSASELPRLDEADTAAKALGYVHDASALNDQARGGPGRICSGCQFYTEADAPWGPCTLFPGKAVSAQGWCKGWVARS